MQQLYRIFFVTVQLKIQLCIVEHIDKLKIAMLHTFFHWQKSSKIILEKERSYFRGIFRVKRFLRQKFENSPSER
jgi:hypothetical protein